MLWVCSREQFQTKHPKFLDWSDSTPQELVEQAETTVNHHASGAVFLGHLEGWMLSVTQEIRMRPLVRKFAVGVTSRYPMALSSAWKNELEVLQIPEVNGHSHSDHDGGLGSHTVPNEHGRTPAQTPNPVPPAEGGKARRPAARRKLPRQDSTPSEDGGTQEAHGVRS